MIKEPSKMKLQTFTMLIFLFFLVALAAYLDSPYSFINKGYSYMTSEQAVAQPVDVEPPTEMPVLEQKLENVKKVGSYMVETYQEYEVYYDKEGNVVKTEPTSKTETVRYWNKKSEE
jgi:hypothetical protein